MKCTRKQVNLNLTYGRHGNDRLPTLRISILYLAAIPMGIIRHDRYYFDDGNTIFRVRSPPALASHHTQIVPILQVEDILFSVHRSILTQHSPIFEDMFCIQSGEGESDEKPILLEGTSSLGFASLLACLYPRYVPTTIQEEITDRLRCPSRALAAPPARPMTCQQNTGFSPWTSPCAGISTPYAM